VFENRVFRRIIGLMRKETIAGWKNCIIIFIVNIMQIVGRVVLCRRLLAPSTKFLHDFCSYIIRVLRSRMRGGAVM
jgi:hypothetical protein